MCVKEGMIIFLNQVTLLRGKNELKVLFVNTLWLPHDYSCWSGILTFQKDHAFQKEIFKRITLINEK